jgi:hypothetical protein
MKIVRFRSERTPADIRSLRTTDFSQSTLERAQRQVSGFAGRFDHKTIGETQSRAGAKEF